MRVVKFYNLQDREVGSIPLDIAELEAVSAKPVELMQNQLDEMRNQLDLALRQLAKWESLSDAPRDGKLYARCNGIWEVIPGAPELLKIKQ